MSGTTFIRRIPADRVVVALLQGSTTRDITSDGTYDVGRRMRGNDDTPRLRTAGGSRIEV